MVQTSTWCCQWTDLTPASPGSREIWLRFRLFEWWRAILRITKLWIWLLCWPGVKCSLDLGLVECRLQALHVAQSDPYLDVCIRCLTSEYKQFDLRESRLMCFLSDGISLGPTMSYNCQERRYTIRRSVFVGNSTAKNATRVFWSASFPSNEML